MKGAYKKLSTHTLMPLPLASTPASAGFGASFTDTSDLIDLNFTLTGGNPGFCVFSITGDSSVPHIFPGALAVVNTHLVPEHGDTILVEHEGGVCVKVLEIKPKLRLISRNIEYEPREVREEDAFVILGVVIAAINIFRRSDRTLRLTG